MLHWLLYGRLDWRLIHLELVRLMALKGEIVARWWCVVQHLLLLLLIAESACLRQVVIMTTRTTSTHTSGVAIKGKVVGWRRHRQHGRHQLRIIHTSLHLVLLMLLSTAEVELWSEGVPHIVVGLHAGTETRLARLIFLDSSWFRESFLGGVGWLLLGHRL